MKSIKPVVLVMGAVLSLVLLHGALGQDPVYPVEPKGLKWVPPKDESSFINENFGAQYVGLLFAGIFEFNWIVDVRVRGETEGFSSIGNLVTYYHVLTSCRATRVMLERTKISRRYTKQEGYDWDVIKFTAGTDILVTYCRSYLLEGGMVFEEETDTKLSGMRHVLEIALHPQCSRTSLLNDVAVMVLGTGISAVVPNVGYMPVNLDYRTEKTLPTQPGHLKETSLCYVASYGRGFYNLAAKDDATHGYKVKYRVYLENWKTCTDVYSYICNGYDSEQCKDNIEDLNILCFSTRAKVGTVCDHDKGAPVVCQGEVIGIVIRGAKEQHCNNLFNIPFLALKLDGFKSFLDQTVEWLDRPVAKYEDVESGTATTSEKPKTHGGSAPNGLRNIALMLVSAVLITARHLL